MAFDELRGDRWRSTEIDREPAPEPAPESLALRPTRSLEIASSTMRTTLTATLVALLLAGAVHAQTWLTDPAFGAQRNAYGPGVHMDATGRAYRDTPSMLGCSSRCARTPTVPASAATRSGAPSCRRTTCPTSARARATRGTRRRPTAPRPPAPREATAHRGGERDARGTVNAW
jgi:hypothetical protein